MNQMIPDSDTRRALALAEVNFMNESLIKAKETIEQLKADLHREEDRVVMMVEERDRYRNESIRFRKLLIVLSTKMVNASLLMDAAKDVLTEIEEIEDAPTPSAAAIDKLEEDK